MSCFRSLLARLREAHLRIDAEREQSLLAGVAVLEAPVARAVRVNEQAEAAAVEHLSRLLAGLCAPDLEFGALVTGQLGRLKRLVVVCTPYRSAAYPRLYPHSLWTWTDNPGRRWTKYP